MGIETWPGASGGVPATPDTPNCSCGFVAWEACPTCERRIHDPNRACQGRIGHHPYDPPLPAPTPSALSVRAARARVFLSVVPNIEEEFYSDDPLPEALDAYESAIRAESAEALQEARERMGAANRELSALSSDKQTLMTAVTHWRERAEKAEAELKRRGDVDEAARGVVAAFTFLEGRGVNIAAPGTVLGDTLAALRAALARSTPAPSDGGDA